MAGVGEDLEDVDGRRLPKGKVVCVREERRVPVLVKVTVLLEYNRVGEQEQLQTRRGAVAVKVDEES